MLPNNGSFFLNFLLFVESLANKFSPNFEFLAGLEDDYNIFTNSNTSMAQVNALLQRPPNNDCFAGVRIARPPHYV